MIVDAESYIKLFLFSIDVIYIPYHLNTIFYLIINNQSF